MKDPFHTNSHTIYVVVYSYSHSRTYYIYMMWPINKTIYFITKWHCEYVHFRINNLFCTIFCSDTFLFSNMCFMWYSVLLLLLFFSPSTLSLYVGYSAIGHIVCHTRTAMQCYVAIAICCYKTTYDTNMCMVWL